MPEFRDLEIELWRELRPVEAPESLWEAIEAQRRKQPGRIVDWRIWPVAAFVVLGACTGMGWKLIASHAAPLPLAEQELAMLEQGPVPIEFHSSQMAEIRKWVLANSRIDIALPSSSPAFSPALSRAGYEDEPARVLGAGLLQLGGVTVAAIVCKVRGEDATLLVTRGRGPGAKTRLHEFWRRSSRGQESLAQGKSLAQATSRGLQLASWSLGGENYSLVSTNTDFNVKTDGACQLCHAY